jgi:hypothetical protein
VGRPLAIPAFANRAAGDIYAIIRRLVRCGYSNTIILDHAPPFVAAAGPGAPTAFAIAYISACIRGAQAELQIERREAVRSPASRLPMSRSRAHTDARSPDAQALAEAAAAGERTLVSWHRLALGATAATVAYVGFRLGAAIVRAGAGAAQSDQGGS